MALPRPSCLRTALGRGTLRRIGASTRSNAFRQGGRRTYASGHEAKKSSDLPWMIGSAALTIPAATWLLGQAPAKSDHGHHETEPKVVKDPGAEEGAEEESKPEDGDDEGKEKSQDEGKDEDKSEEEANEAKEQAPSDDSGSDDEGKDTPPPSDDESADEGEEDKPGPNAPAQINKIGQSKSVKPLKPTEKKGEKDSQKDFSGAQHPYLSDPSKSKKAEGLTDTAKIHGTVDPRRNSSKPSE